MKTNLKKLLGERAYNVIKNMDLDGEKLRKAFVTSKNAKACMEDLDEYQIKSLLSTICGTDEIGTVLKSTQEEITAKFNSVGYDTVIFDDEEKIAECAKYYAEGERICTYNNLKGRMDEYHMIVAVKKNIDKIKRSNHPQREDEYGTSILNIQIAKNGSHMSIKNRYNHTIANPDSTFNNNLNNLCDGLQSMVLGYYGFAYLGKKDKNYDNIIKINDVYLKYFEEKDNIYYGAFVLDSQHGVRYNDTSRYYILKNMTGGWLSKGPIILDFKEKKAICCSQSINPQAPLLERAMKEGLLSSANKEISYHLDFIFKDVKKEILRCSNDILQAIHKYYGYDFTKPFTTFGFSGNFTAKKLEKITGYKDGILFVSKGTNLCICDFKNGKLDAKDKKLFANNIDRFYRQSDFEDLRKDGLVMTYFVHQNKKYHLPIKNDDSYSRYYFQNRDEYDKCGNNLTEIRYALRRRFNAYQTQKRANEAKQIDFSKDIQELQQLLDELKRKVIKFVSESKTYEDFNVLNDIFSYGLAWVVRDMQNIIKNSENKTFASIEEATDEINKTKNSLLKRISKLDNRKED